MRAARFAFPPRLDAWLVRLLDQDGFERGVDRGSQRAMFFVVDLDAGAR